MKNLVLFSVLLLTSVGAIAQLFIRPTSPTDPSYIYVDSTVIYVKGNVELQKNNSSPSDKEASIYLRHGAQLIQGGDGTTAGINSGDGFLSVQQTSPESNAWAYNYWCSPVGVPIPLSTGNTDFGVGSIYEDMNPEEGTGTSAKVAETTPTRNGARNPLTISTYWIYQMTEPATEALASYDYIGATNTAEPGYGFTMKGVGTELPGDSQLYEFRGRPNNGNFPITVKGPAVTPNGPNPTYNELAKMTLTGNPYPSALDLNKLFYDPENTALNCIYYYDEDRTVPSHLYNTKPYGYGVWVPGPEDVYTNDEGPTATPEFEGYYTAAAFFIWNAAGDQNGTSTGPGTDVNKKRFALIAQGFMFVGNGPDTLTQFVKIKNSHRVFQKEGPYSQFQRPAGEAGNFQVAAQNNETSRSLTSSTDAETVEPNATPQLRLYVVFDDALSRDLLLIFHPQTTDGFDRGFDGLSPMGMKSDAYFPIGPDGNRRAYAIQGTNYDPRKMIPLTLKLHKTSQIEIRAIEEIRKPYERAYLFDRQENIYRPLLKPHNAASTFTLPAGNYDNRFFIVFRAAGSPRPGGNEDMIDAQTLAKADVVVFQNNPEQHLEISNPEGYNLKAAYIYDMNGKLVISNTKLGDGPHYSFYTGNLSDGVYLVKLITADDVVLDYKAMVMNK